MKTLLTLLFTLTALFSMAQKQTGWSPLMDSIGTEIVADERYLVLIVEEKAVFNDVMKAEIDFWLAALNSTSKKDRGVVISKAAFVDHKQVYGNSKEVARKNSLKGEWVIPK
jgi:hypothetical protein